MGETPTDLGQLVVLAIALAVWALIRYVQWRWPEPPTRPSKRKRKTDDDDA